MYMEECYAVKSLLKVQIILPRNQEHKCRFNYKERFLEFRLIIFI